MIRNLFNKGKCKLGFHQGEWHYAEPANCTQTRTCERCQQLDTRLEHQWGEWQPGADDPCQLITTCQRCGESKRRTEHQWGEWQYDGPDSCGQIRQCARCGSQKTGQPKHQWGEWQYQAADSCLQQQSCIRCGIDSPRSRQTHSWGDWYFADVQGSPAHSCLRCGEISTQHTPKDGARRRKRKPTVDEISSSVQQIFNTNNTAETEAALHAHKSILFSAPADDFLRRSIHGAPAGSRAETSFKELWVLLRQCEQLGVDTAMAQNISQHLTQAASTTNAAERPHDAKTGPEATKPTGRKPTSAKASSTSPQRTPRPKKQAAAPAPKSQPTATRPSQTQPQPASEAPADGQLDPRLCGQWRYTNTLFAGGTTMVSSTYMYLRSDGFLARSREALVTGAFRDVASGSYAGTSVHHANPAVKVGRWFVHNGELHLHFEDGDHSSCPYKVSQDSLLCITPAKKQLWTLMAE